MSALNWGADSVDDRGLLGLSAYDPGRHISDNGGKVKEGSYAGKFVASARANCGVRDIGTVANDCGGSQI